MRGKERERKEDEGENIAEKVKKKNKIKIKGLRSYFTLHSDGKNAGGTLNLGERKNSSQRRKEERSYGKKLKKRRRGSILKELFYSFILQNLLGWAHIACLGQPI